ncbi:tol-pal system protein YbgF [Rhodocyclus gracilis]|uniref:tol-pal system protein YbgF n=1 Tax=Rhodocyclus gracilis TaxID=2929842 RepID=UPI001E64903B|nr:tol-pal system protein YbgF [Rhodocyclus gracilis]
MMRRRPMTKPTRPTLLTDLTSFSTAALCLLLSLGAAPAAHAGLFDDDEARRQISDLTAKSAERHDTTTKAQFELANQLQALREETARLQGQVETLTYELDAEKKRQQDFYIDLDTRLRKLEPAPGSDAHAADGKPADAASDAKSATPARPAADPAAEGREYEAALNLFKGKKFKDAGTAFSGFVKAHPDSTLAPNAQYWFGNALYAQGDCKKAIEAHTALVARWSQHAKASDALLNISACQQELGDNKASRKTLESLLAKYPDSPAAATAKQRLSKK